MAKDPFDIDEILSEIHQRKARENNNSAENGSFNIDKKNEEKIENKDVAEDVKNELLARANAEKEAKRKMREAHAEEERQKDEQEKQRIAEEKVRQAREMARIQEEEQKKKEAERRQMLEERRLAAEKAQREALERAKKAQDEQSLYVDEEMFEKNENKKRKKGKNKNKNNGEDMVDINSFSDEKPRFSQTKKGKIVISVICVLLAVLIAVGVGAWATVNSKLNKITNDGGTKANSVEEYTGMDKLVEKNFDKMIYENGNVSSLKNMVKDWYENGEPVSSSRVLNVLLVGEDSEGDLDSETRADSAIIASINVDTKKIILTSVLRDSYAYWQTKDGEGSFGKINGATSTSGMDSYIETVERLYKINIDNYVRVNFTSFEKIIDKLGGVTINMSKAEVNEINSYPKRYNYPDKIVASGKYTYDEKEGRYTTPIKLDGAQALAYCRIRKIDGDDVRANRQKTVLMTVFKGLEQSTISTFLSAVNTMTDYVRTGYSTKEIVSLGKYALSNGWLNYEIEANTVPCEECRKGGTFHNTWMWKVDYPKCAYELQMKLYGKSNITLADNRPKFDEIAF